ncbi:recombinase family protein [uncultured Roseobacter sp.]|uniref:recombinase family protein n=1 Tax=uncultured Roseobacter sp. TaxID=114847 RepID=UPI00262BE62B|nr:recombinase family protein [uncultured Roseobacter sp.]
MKTLGYLRISTQDQTVDRQYDALADLCDEVFVECASAATLKRPVFERVLSELTKSDTLVVLDLDRAFRSVIDALQTVEDLHKRGVALKIVNLQMDTTTPAGMLLFTVLSSFAAFERQINSQRTREGMAAARKRGKPIGRPPKLTPKDLADAQHRIQSGRTIKQVAAKYNMAPWSLTRAIRRLNS